MCLQFIEGHVHHFVLAFFILLGLEFENKHGLRIELTLRQIRIESRHGLAVVQFVLEQGVECIGPNQLPLYIVVVMDDNLIVSCDVDVKFASPEIILLGCFERCDGIFSMFRFIAFPKTSVRRNSNTSSGLRQHRKRHHRRKDDGRNGQKCFLHVNNY